MIKKVIRYKDLNDAEREETFYFHLSKANLLALEAKRRGGLKWYLERISQSHDTEEIWGFLREIVLMSYGQRSDDGSRLIKTPQIRDEFESSEAFSELMMSFFTDVNNASEFINGIVPHEMRQQMAQVVPPPGPRPAVAEEPVRTDWNVFEKDRAPRPADSPLDRDEAAHVPTESMMQPPQGALSDQPAARVLTEAEIREMDPVELQRGLVEGRFKLAP